MPPECLKINEGIMTRVYLVRHGENKANITKEFSSRKVDYPLTPKGRLQAE
jgi:broad specificity phosphatase PhoE